MMSQDFVLNENQFSKIKVGWLSDLSNNYEFEIEIIDMCEKKLNDLNKYNIKIDYLNTSMSKISLTKIDLKLLQKLKKSHNMIIIITWQVFQVYFTKKTKVFQRQSTS